MDAPNSSRTEGAQEGTDSALQGYFNSFMPLLESTLREKYPDNYDQDVDDDATFDLAESITEKSFLQQQIVPKGDQRQQQGTTSQVTVTKRSISSQQVTRTSATPRKENFRVQSDPVLDELELILEQFRKKNSYSYKLIDIMLKGLEKTLGRDSYYLFLKGRLPDNWLPIVRMNSDNTPYVEFLIKSDVSDQDPDSQLSDFTMAHVSYSKFIVERLREGSQALGPTTKKPRAVNEPSEPKRISSSQANLNEPMSLIASRDTPIDPLLSIASSRAKSNSPRKSISSRADPSNPKKVLPSRTDSINSKKVLPSRADSINPKKALSSRADLNDSKRVLPSRACKTNKSYPG